MALIPNIPESDETKNIQQSEHTNPIDEILSQQLKSKHIQLQNGKVNQPYGFLFDITLFEIADIGRFEFIGLGAIGLTFNESTDSIEGIPTVAGDHKITLRCFRHNWEEGMPVFERQLTLIINPDPKSLWNDIPTAIDIPYYKPDSDSIYIKVKDSHRFLKFGNIVRKDIVAASQRGRSHAHEGSPRDDDFRVVYNEDSEWYTLAVADGAGSAAYSREGAKIACQTVLELCNSELEKHNKEMDAQIHVFNKHSSDANRKQLGDKLYNIIGTAVFNAYKNIEKEALENENQVKDYATTLLMSVAKKYKFGWFITSFWIGDGAIAIYNQETQYLKIMGTPDGGEFAGQTRFLTMPEMMQSTEIYKRLRFEIISDFSALILMTDGVTDPKFETDANLQRIEKWNEFWQDLNSSVQLLEDKEDTAHQLLRWLDFWSPGNHDDRTIAILH